MLCVCLLRPLAHECEWQFPVGQQWLEGLWEGQGLGGRFGPNEVGQEELQRSDGGGLLAGHWVGQGEITRHLSHDLTRHEDRHTDGHAVDERGVDAWKHQIPMGSV